METTTILKNKLKNLISNLNEEELDILINLAGGFTHKEIQDKINKIYNEADQTLIKINEKQKNKYANIKSMFECDVDYYRDVARYAWGERGKQIAVLQLQSYINKPK